MKLKSALKTLTPPQLRSVAEFWGIDVAAVADDQRSLVDCLYPRLQTAQYFRTAFDKLEKPHRDLLYFFAIHGCELPLEEVAERCFAGDRAACAAAVATLSETAFVFEDAAAGAEGTILSLPDAYLRFIELPAHWKGYLGNLLHGLTGQQIGEIQANLPLPRGKGARKHLPLHGLRQLLLDPKVLPKYLDAIPQQERQLFDALVERKGFCLYRDLLDPSTPRRFDHAKTEHLNSLIANRGIVFPVAEGANKYTNLLMVPRDLYHLVTNGYAPDKRPLAALDGTAVARPDMAPPVILDYSRTLLRDLSILASFVTSQPLKRLTSGGINKNDLKRALPLLGGNKSLRYAMFLATFLVGRKYLISIGSHWRMVDNFLDWLEAPKRCYWDMFSWWLSSRDWLEHAEDGSCLFTEDRLDVSFDLLELRKAVVSSIASIPGDKWISFKAFHDSLKPTVETSFPSFGEGKTGERFRQILKRVIGESLNWLGLMSVGLYESSSAKNPGEPAKRGGARRKQADTRDQELWFQSTQWGTSVFDSHYLDPGSVSDEDIPAIPLQYEAAWIIVQPNLEITAPPDLAPAHVYQLAGFCAIRNVDVMTTFEITRESLRAALDRGMQGAEILKFLRELSRVDVPDTVTHLIKDCSSKHGEAYISPASGYITADDPVVIEEIRANPKVLPLIKETVADSMLVLAPDADLRKIAQILRHSGLMPHVETGGVHRSSDERYHLSLSSQEFCDLIAAARFLRYVEEQLGAEISEGKAAALAQKLKPEAATFATVRHYADTTSRTFEKRFKAALKQVTDDIEERYKGQLSRLVSRSMSGRGPSKYNYRGPNPAVEREDILSLIAFARDYELDVEIQYIRQNDQEALVTLTPKSVEGNRLYAHCVDTDSDAMYALDRILRAKLL